MADIDIDLNELDDTDYRAPRTPRTIKVKPRRIKVTQHDDVAAKVRRASMNEGGPGSGNFEHAGRPGEVGGSALIVGGKITDEDVNEAYRYGKCMFLALALHDKYGLPMEVAFDHSDGDGYIAHAWVAQGENGIDADGVQPLHDLRGVYLAKGGKPLAGVTISQPSREELFAMLRGKNSNAESNDEDLNEARKVADKYFTTNANVSAE